MTETTDPPRDTEAPKKARRLTPGLVVELLAALIMVVMMLHITANALLRTFFRNPIPLTLEITQYWYMPLIAFLGFIAAETRGQHIAADLIYERLPEVTKKHVLGGVFVLIAVLSAIFCWFTAGEALHAYNIGQVAGVTKLPSWPTYFLAPIAFGAMTIQFLFGAWKAWAKGDLGHLATDMDSAIADEALEEMAHKQEAMEKS